jgi:hypothetical protein
MISCNLGFRGVREGSLIFSPGLLMEPHHFRLPLLAALVLAVFGLAGCGSRGGIDGSMVERCKPGSAACLSSQLGQICNQQGQWASFQCASGQTCQNDICVAADGHCAAGTTQCLNNQVGQICDQQGQWVTLACSSHQVCRDNACVAAEEPCAAGATQCLSSQVGQICDQQGQWVTLACSSDQACLDKTCVAADKPCVPGATQCLNNQAIQSCGNDGQWVTSACESGQTCSDGRCQGVCSPKLHECLTDYLQHICLNDGSSWVTSECPSELKCANGECIGTCEPGSRQCATTRVARECRSDGSGFVEQECLTGMSCEQGACVPDVTAACTVGKDTCKDTQTALICKPDGSGYDVKTCSEGTTCQTGQCMGPICAAGQTSCANTDVINLTSVQTCNEDGSGYTVSICRAHEQCILNKTTTRHECYVPPCDSGETICGDPASTQSSADRLSRCQTLPNGELGWVTYVCSTPSACVVNDWGVAECYAECAPGDRRCSSDENAIEDCGEDGKWSQQSCDQIGSGIQACLVVPTNHQVVCGDPDCSSLQYDRETYKTYGRCLSDQIRKCGDDGKLHSAVPCDEGMCLPESDGFGVCKDPNRCNQAEGWRECVTDNDAYRTCLSSHWEFTLCENGQQCTDDSQGHAACGDDCDPGARRCSGADYQVCLAGGTWGPPTPCASGECSPSTTLCEIACQPGDTRCVGDVLLVSDGTSLGSAGMQVCQTDGGWGITQACATAQYCRRSGNGVHIGCVECVGDSVPGGNEENAVDSRCNADGTGRQICSSNNTWPTAVTACGSGEQCVKRRDGTIRGSCSDYGCSSSYSRRCVGYETLTTPETISDCCAGDCQSETAECWHRQAQYDPTCLETTSCYTGRYDTQYNAIYETCCSGYCKSGQGCLRIKGQPCASVTSCEVNKVGRATVCCGDCQTDGSCLKGQEAEHPLGEYFTCGSTSTLCWSIGSCTWTPGSGVSGAMYADCRPKPDAG